MITASEGLLSLSTDRLLDICLDLLRSRRSTQVPVAGTSDSGTTGEVQQSVATTLGTRLGSIAAGVLEQVSDAIDDVAMRAGGGELRISKQS